jgi:hypothetical protein
VSIASLARGVNRLLVDGLCGLELTEGIVSPAENRKDFGLQPSFRDLTAFGEGFLALHEDFPMSSLSP